MTEPGMDDKSIEDEDVPSKTPLFLFYTCKTSGSNFLRHKLLDIAVHCWPYDDKAPVFFRKIHPIDKGKGQGKARGGQTRKSSNNEHSCRSSQPAIVGVFEELLQWIDSTVEKASTALGLTLYPVLIAHWGETFQFLFLFRMLENHGVSASETLATHNVHFADPVPVLKQYKEARHPWLVESRSLGLGSLLNDWFPAQFDEADLRHSRGCCSLVLKLYTESPLYWLLYRIPIYDTQEWLEFYEGEKLYREDKWELEENVPSSVVGIQRKMTIRRLLRHGYNWSSLIDLYKSCGSPTHFQQELRDMDIKTGAAGRITVKMTGMDLEQDGSREYKVHIKSNMPYAKYYHQTDARGRHFILRVANVLPPCFFSLADLCDNRWQVPDNLLQIGPLETWDAMLPRASHDINGNSHGDRVQGFEEADVFGPHGYESELSAFAGLMDVQSGEESEPEWDKTEDCDIPLCENGDLPDCYFKEPAPTHVPTTLVKGAKGSNPFAFPEQEWLAVDKPEHMPGSDLQRDEKSSDKSSSVSNNQSKADSNCTPANQTASADLHRGAAANPESPRTWKNQGTNHRDCKVSRHSAPTNQSSRKPAQSYHSTWTNQNDSSETCHFASANQNNLSGRRPAKYSSNKSSDASCQKNSAYSTSTNDKRSSKSCDFVVSNQRTSMEPCASRPTNHSPRDGSRRLSSTSSSTLSSDELSMYHTQGAIPREKRCDPSRCPSKNNGQSSPANQTTAKQTHPSTTANHSSPNEHSGPSSTSSCTQHSVPRDKAQNRPRNRSRKKNGGKKMRHES